MTFPLLKNLILVLFFTIIVHPIFAQSFSIERVDPPFWWAGMKSDELQLCFYGKNLKDTRFSLNHEQVVITSVSFADSPNYAFVNLSFTDSLVPCTLFFKLTQGKKSLTYSYIIKKREQTALAHQGFGSEDLIYLILPDRFANGDTTNDVIKGMNEEHCHRDSIFYRHGGDLQGIINKLDYLDNLGITALWLNPVLENNQPFASYHGYAITDHYKVDPRLGTNEKYSELIKECHKKGIKVIKDMVFNHIGNEHWFYKDMPFKDWTHEHDSFMFSNFRVTTLLDPYASKYELNKMQYGWFDKHMPDLNHSNPFLRTYLIQNAIWWIEYAGLNGFRFDTYAYSDYLFMSYLCKRILEEYPDFNMVGEIWDNGVVIQAFFTHDNCNNNYFQRPNLPGVTDFQLYHAINNMLNEQYGWNKGVERVYYTLASDIAYKNPFNNLIFLDNHDLSRFYSVAGENLNKFKMAIGLLLTTRGIPMLYYGTEILMKNFKGPDEKVREDFPGGWLRDRIDKFNEQNLNAEEKEAFEFVKKLANWRKNNLAVTKGKLMQYVPFEGVYVFFRYYKDQKVMVVINSSENVKQFNTENFNEILSHQQKVKNVISDKIWTLDNINIEPMSILFLEIFN